MFFTYGLCTLRIMVRTYTGINYICTE
jgi:hypothetical protein